MGQNGAKMGKNVQNIGSCNKLCNTLPMVYPTTIFDPILNLAQKWGKMGHKMLRLLKARAKFLPDSHCMDPGTDIHADKEK